MLVPKDNLTPLELFELFLNKDVIELFVTYTIEDRVQNQVIIMSILDITH